MMTVQWWCYCYRRQLVLRTEECWDRFDQPVHSDWRIWDLVLLYTSEVHLHPHPFQHHLVDQCNQHLYQTTTTNCNIRHHSWCTLLAPIMLCAKIFVSCACTSNLFVWPASRLAINSFNIFASSFCIQVAKKCCSWHHHHDDLFHHCYFQASGWGVSVKIRDKGPSRADMYAQFAKSDHRLILKRCTCQKLSGIADISSWCWINFGCFWW